MDRIETNERVADIVERALEVPAEQRGRLIVDLCGDDGALRREVESLLGFQDKATGFIEKPAYQIAADTVVDTGGEFKPDELVGQYQIVSLIGEGGMGEVYLAQDTSLGRQVAIKLLKFGLGTANIIRHFHQEERILAGLSHPNIAQLYGGDVTVNGLPYFVMEYVEGARLDDYCRDHNLSVADRLELFRKICSAVAYAHQHLIIHRDLKPANIRVTAQGEPKLLDFGIARLLDPVTSKIADATLTFAAVMTPEYASPEQIRGEVMTTASDVYSLGVVLYELLTEQKPYKIDNRSPTAIARVIAEQQPTRPSTAANKPGRDTALTGTNGRLLRGDLDNIILKALRKEPDRRYPSVTQLSEDIRRHLEGLPVAARKGTLRYRTGKFVVRNKPAVAAGLLILVTLLAGIVATALEARRADRQRARAEQRFNDVRRLADSLMFEIHDSVKDLQGSTPTRRLIVSRALEYLDSLAREAGDNASLQRELATGYEKVGDIQGNPYYANLGDTDGALASYRKAMAIREALRKDGNVDAAMEMGRSYRSLGDILEQKGNVAATVDNYRRSLAIFQDLAVAHPDNLAVKDELARAHEVLGDGLARTQMKEERLRSYQNALSIREQLLAKTPNNPKLRRSIALSYMKIGGVMDPAKPQAVEDVRRGISVLETLSTEDPNNERAYRDVGFGYYALGQVQVAGGDFTGALTSRRKAFEIRQRIAQEDPKDAQAQFDLAVAHGDLSEALTASGDGKAAMADARAALSILEQLSAADATNVVYRRNVGLCYEKFAEAYARLGADEKERAGQRVKDWTEARNWYRKAEQLFSDLRAHGNLMPADAAEPQKFADKCSACDQALAQLNH